MTVICPNCGSTVGEQIGGKLGLAFAGALLGSRVHPAAALLFGLAGMAAGHYYIDSQIRTCAQCGLVLRIVDDFLF